MSDRAAGPDDHLSLRPRASDQLGLGEGRELGMDQPSPQGAYICTNPLSR